MSGVLRQLGPGLAIALAGCAAEGHEFGFGAMLARTLILLVLVGCLAVVTLRLAARYGVGVGKPRGSAARLEVLEEISLGARHSVIAIRVASRVVVASRTPAGLRRLSEISLREWREQAFGDVLASLERDPSTEESPPLEDQELLI